jgi:predicted dehydrogenase
METKLRWGVLSTANIGVKKVIPGMQRGTLTSVDAIASRDLAKAHKAANALGIAKAYGSYEELLADPDLDAITTHCPTSCTFHGPSRPPKPVSMCSARSR